MPCYYVIKHQIEIPVSGHNFAALCSCLFCFICTGHGAFCSDFLIWSSCMKENCGTFFFLCWGRGGGEVSLQEIKSSLLFSLGLPLNFLLFFWNILILCIVTLDMSLEEQLLLYSYVHQLLPLGLFACKNFRFARRIIIYLFLNSYLMLDLKFELNSSPSPNSESSE